MPIVQSLTRSRYRHHDSLHAPSYRQKNAGLDYLARDTSKWGCDRYSGNDKVKFSVNKPIRLRGVEHFGSLANEYTVNLKINCIEPFRKCLVRQSGDYASTAKENCKYYAFDVLFDRPIHLKACKDYEILSIIKGPLSRYGERSHGSVEYQGVIFTFKDPHHEVSEAQRRTNASCGQFPSLIFT